MPDVPALHAVRRIAGVHIDSWNLALPDTERGGFIGDRASRTAFDAILAQARRRLRTADDPFRGGDVDSHAIDHVLLGGQPDAAHVVHLAVEEWARQFAYVVQCFLVQPEWQGVSRIVVGGGFPQSVHGGLAVRRAARILANARVEVALHVLAHDPDEAGMLGWAPLATRYLRGFDTFLAVDLGGTNARCAIVKGDAVAERMQWRHADDAPSRDEAVARIAGMLDALAVLAGSMGLRLAPFVGVASPGEVHEDGLLGAGTQNLPGDWNAPFHLPTALARRLAKIAGRRPVVALHNDAVVQGLSEHARMRGAAAWGVLTIGTGLGNASYRRAR